MLRKFCVFGFLVLMALSSSAQKSHQFELIADSRKPRIYEWSYRDVRTVSQRFVPTTWEAGYTRLKGKPNFRYGWRAAIAFGNHYHNYSITEYLGSGPIHYQIKRPVHSFMAEIGYKTEWRLNTLRGQGSETQGTYLQLVGGAGHARISTPGYYDKQGDRTLVIIKEIRQTTIHAHLFLGLCHYFSLGTNGPMYYALAGTDGFTSTDNGFYAQLNYRLGIGVKMP